jgi:hypothetical protein
MGSILSPSPPDGLRFEVESLRRDRRPSCSNECLKSHMPRPAKSDQSFAGPRDTIIKAAYRATTGCRTVRPAAADHRLWRLRSLAELPAIVPHVRTIVTRLARHRN